VLSLGIGPAALHDEGGFIWIHHAAGSSLEETNRVLTRVEGILREVPEVENTSARTGLQLGLAQVTEATPRYRRPSQAGSEALGDEVIADVREKSRRFPMLQVEFIQLLQDMIGDLTSAPEPVESSCSPKTRCASG